MTETPEDYRWSSYHNNGMGLNSSLATPHELYLGLGKTRASRQKNYRKLCGEPVDELESTKIRDAVRTESILGSTRFVQALEKITGRCLRPQKPKISVE